jgi:hypothetical protein
VKRLNHPGIRFGRQVAAAFGLLFYLVALSPIGMATVALLGALDSDHQALFKPSVDGLSLVLHHPAKCVPHQHHAIARTLTLFSQPASPTNPDHVVRFASSERLLRDSQPIIFAENSLQWDQFVPAEPVLTVSAETKPPLPMPDPPDGTIGNLRSLPSTVLLI